MLLSSDTRSDSSLRKQTQRGDMSNGKGKIPNRSSEKTRAIRPTARILLLTILRRSAASGDGCVDTAGTTTDSSSELSMSSSREHVFSTATSISATFPRTRVSRQCSNKGHQKALTLLANKRQTPGKCIHKVGQPVWVWRAIKLPYIQNVRFIFEDRCLVVVHVKIIWSGKQCHHGWETSRASFPVHAVPACHTPLATIYTR
jgi:hypothetical protein